MLHGGGILSSTTASSSTSPKSASSDATGTNRVARMRMQRGGRSNWSSGGAVCLMISLEHWGGERKKKRVSDRQQKERKQSGVLPQHATAHDFAVGYRSKCGLSRGGGDIYKMMMRSITMAQLVGYVGTVRSSSWLPTNQLQLRRRWE